MITQGFLARHFQGRAGMRDAALLDVAQDYALKHLFDEGIFELGVILKGELRCGSSVPETQVDSLRISTSPPRTPIARHYSLILSTMRSYSRFDFD